MFESYSLRPIFFTQNLLHYPCLKKEITKGKTSIDCQSFGKLLKSCPNLTELSISPEDDTAEPILDILRAVCKTFPTLKEITLDNDSLDIDVSFRYL